MAEGDHWIRVGQHRAEEDNQVSLATLDSGGYGPSPGSAGACRRGWASAEGSLWLWWLLIPSAGRCLSRLYGVDVPAMSF